MWWMLASAAIKGAQGMGAAASQNTATAVQYKNQMIANKETNQAIQEANLQNTIRTGYRIGVLNVQESQARMSMLSQKAAVGEQGLAALGQSHANAAAAGAVGSSVAAASNDIQMKVDEAKDGLNAAWDVSMFNFDNALQDMIMAGQDSLRDAVKADYTGPAYTSTSGAFLGGAASSLASFGMQYASLAMSLGSPASSAATTTGGMSYNTAASGSWYGVANSAQTTSSWLSSLGYK